MNVLTALPPETLRALTADELVAVAVAVGPQDAAASGAVVDELGRRRVVAPEVLEGLRLLGHEDAAHVEVGRDVLERHGHSLDVAADVRTAEALCDDADPASRRRALQVVPAALVAQGRVQRLRLMMALTLATLDDDPTVVVAAIGVLAARGDAEGLPALLRNVGHPARRVRDAVARHLPAVAGEPPHRRPADECPELVGEADCSVRALALVLSPQDRGDSAAKGDRTGSRARNAERFWEYHEDEDVTGRIIPHPGEPPALFNLRRYEAAASPVGDARLLAALLRVQLEDGDRRAEDLQEAIDTATKRCRRRFAHGTRYKRGYYAGVDTLRVVDALLALLDAKVELEQAALDGADASIPVEDVLSPEVALLRGDICDVADSLQRELRRRDDNDILRRALELCSEDEPNMVRLGLGLLGGCVGRAYPDVAVPLALELAAHRDPDVASYALVTLGCLADTRGLPTLLASLDSDCADVRRDATAGLRLMGCRQGDPEFLAALIPLTRHPDVHVRWAAVEGLAEREGDPAACDALVACLDDDVEYIRSEAVVGLASNHDERAVRPILEALAAGTTEIWVLRAIFYLPDARFVRPLARLRRRDGKSVWSWEAKHPLEDCRMASRRPVWMVRALVGKALRLILDLRAYGFADYVRISWCARRSQGVILP